MSAGQLLYQGLSDVGDSVAAHFERKRKQTEAVEKEQKEAAQRHSRLVTAIDTLGWMPRNVALTKSLDELEGFTQGKELLGKLGETELTNKVKSLQAAALEREAAGAESFEQAVSQATQPARMAAPGLIPQLNPVGPSQPLTGPRLMEAMGQNPKAFQSRIGSALAERALAAQMEGGPAPYQPEAFEVGGVKGIVSPRTGSIHLSGTPQTGLSFDQRVQLLDRKALQDERKAIRDALKGSHSLHPSLIEEFKLRLQKIEQELQRKATAPSTPAAPGSATPAPAAVTGSPSPLRYELKGGQLVPVGGGGGK